MSNERIEDKGLEELTRSNAHAMDALINVLERKGILRKADVIEEAARLHNAIPDMKCPYCAASIKRDSTVCAYCGRDVPQLRNDPDPYVIRG